MEANESAESELIADRPVLTNDSGDVLSLQGFADLAAVTAWLKPYGLEPIAANGFAQVAINGVTYSDVPAPLPKGYNDIAVGVYVQPIGQTAAAPQVLFTAAFVDNRIMQLFYPLVFALETSYADMDPEYKPDGGTFSVTGRDGNSPVGYHLLSTPTAS